MASAICSYIPTLLCQFPAVDDTLMRSFKKTVDTGFKTFVRSYGDFLDGLTLPLQGFLNWLQALFVDTPWIVMIIALAAIVYGVSRNWRITLGTALAMVLIGMAGLWQDTMITLAMVTVCTLCAVVIGIPLGIWMARSDRAQSVFNPVLDVMQTMPSFVYLIPVVMIFGIGKVPGLIAVVIYAIAPIIRLTNLGIRLVSREAIEAADAFGSSERQKLFNVQISAGAAQHHGGHQPDDHDVAGHGGHCLDDRGWRARQECPAGHHQPVLHHRPAQRLCPCGNRHHFRQGKPGLWQTPPETYTGAAWLVTA